MRPCFKGLRRVLALPAAVRGPVDFGALRRLAAICFGVDISSSAFRMAGRVNVCGVIGWWVLPEVVCLRWVEDFLICRDWRNRARLGGVRIFGAGRGFLGMAGIFGRRRVPKIAEGLTVLFIASYVARC